MFKGRHFDQSIILLCVRWYLAYGLSLRDLKEMMSERGIRVDGTVNLSASGQGRARGLRSGYLKMGDLAPHLHRGPSQLVIMVR